ncbi:MAG: protein kinase domain-containing protein [Candidatus Xenobia bacterium]
MQGSELVLPARFEVVKRIGRGVLGPIYYGHDKVLEQSVALYALDFSEGDVESEQVWHELRRLSGLRHPHLVSWFDVFSDQGRLYLPVEHLDAPTLAQLVGRLARSAEFVSLSSVLSWADTLCDVLAYLHDRGIVYGNLKPANLYLDSEERLRLAALDFPRHAATEFPATTVYLTPGFAALEQHTQQGTGPRTDMYALGATLYFLLTKQVPPPAVDRMMGRELVAPSLWNPQVPERLDAVVMRLMALAKEERYPTAQEARSDLKAAFRSRGRKTTTRKLRARSRSLDVGSLVDNRYRIEKIVEINRHWALYEANGPVSIYEFILPESLEAREEMLAFMRARMAALSEVTCPQLVPLHELIESERAAYLVTDRVEGVTLRDLIGGVEGYLPIPVVTHILEQLCEMLRGLHKVTRFGGLTPAHVVVSDDGHVRVTGFPMGSVEDPEPYSNDDLYSLGACLYTVLTRRPPARDVGQADFGSHVPRVLSALVLRLLQPHSFDSIDDVMVAKPPPLPGEEPFEPVGRVMPMPETQPEPVLTAVVWWPEIKTTLGWLFKGKPAADVKEEVEVTSLSSDALRFLSRWPGRLNTAVRLVIHVPQRGQAPAKMDVRTLIAGAEEGPSDLWHYSIDLRTLPPTLRDVLAGTGPDRRKVPRYRVRLPVSSRDLPADSRAEEIGADGVLIDCSSFLLPGMALQLDLHLPGDHVRVYGRVMRCDQPTGGRWSMGIRFEAMQKPAAARFVSYLQQLKGSS